MGAASAAAVIEEHRAAGREFAAGGVRSFVREQGSGPPVVFLHGIPSSSFLYRKVLPPVADAGFRAVAFDFPGLGLAERPRDFDYSATGLVRFLDAALGGLDIERCHLVVHDIAGPIGCEWAVLNPERVLSLTVLNTVLNLKTHRDSPLLGLARIPVLGRLYLASVRPRLFAYLFRRTALHDPSAMSAAEIEAYARLLKLGDNGQAFLKINRGWQDRAKEATLRRGLARRPYPAQVVWGRHDPTLTARYWEIAVEMLRVDEPLLLPGKHFLQEDQAPAVARAVASLAADGT